MTRHATNPFGKILVQRGVLSVEALEQAVRLKERHGGSLAVNLVITGALDDQTLVSFYRERYDVEPVTEEQLARIDRDMFRRIPVEIVYDAGIMPLWLEGEEDNPRLAVGLIDPSEPEVLEEAAFFAAMELAPKLLTIGQMARHYQRLTGKRWKVDWQTVLARRRIHQARIQAEASEEELVDLFDDPDERKGHLRDLIEQTQQLDASLDNLFHEGEDHEDDFVIQFVSIDGARVHEEEVVELTRVKKAFSATLVGTEVQEDERPRIAKKRKGENKHFLDPAVEGIAAVTSSARSSARPSPALPSIIIDTTLLSDEEAEARLEQLVNAPHELDEAVGPDELFDDPVPTPPATAPLPGLAALLALDVDDEKLFSIEVHSIEGDDLYAASPTAPFAAVPALDKAPVEPDEALEPPTLDPVPAAAHVAVERPKEDSISTDLGWFDDEIEEKIDAISKPGSRDSKDSVTSSPSRGLRSPSFNIIVESAAPSRGQKQAVEASPSAHAPQAADLDAEPGERRAVTLLLSAVAARPEASRGSDPKAADFAAIPATPAAPMAADVEPADVSEAPATTEDSEPVGPIDVAAGSAPAAQEAQDEVKEEAAEVDSGLMEGFTFVLGEEDRGLESASPQLLETLEALEAGEARDQVGVAAVRFLRQRYKRVALLSIRGNAISPWIKWINGDEPTIPSAAIAIPLGELLCFDRAANEDAVFLGPVVSSAVAAEAGEGVQAVHELLEGDLPLSAVVCPISIKDRQIAFLYCDEGAQDTVTVDRQSLAVLKTALEEALLRVILLRKRRRL